jgi:hypothetical protein
MSNEAMALLTDACFGCFDYCDNESVISFLVNNGISQKQLTNIFGFYTDELEKYENKNKI